MSRIHVAANGIGIILAGGRSQRLFPMECPKPLLRVHGKSLLDRAVERLKGLEVFVVCNSGIRRAIELDYKMHDTRGRKPSLAKRRVKGASMRGKTQPLRFFVEPEPRDTAAAVGWALRCIMKSPSLRRKKWLAIMSADHYFPKAGFGRVLANIQTEIDRHPNSLFVLGSPPSFKPLESHSQFGWMIPDLSGATKTVSTQSAPVEKFVEKPNAQTLSSLYSAGGLINGGMFFGTLDAFCSAYKEFFPEALNLKVKFSTLIKQPIDRAIFEKSPRVRVMPLELPWEDLGTWIDWSRLALQEKQTKLSTVNAHNVYAWSDEATEFSVFGLKDIAVVRTGNKVMVMPLSQTPYLKDYLAKIL